MHNKTKNSAEPRIPMKHFVDACEKSWLDKILILFWFWNLENDQWVVRDERNAAQETLFRTSNLFPVLHGQQLHIKSYSIHAHNEKKNKTILLSPLPSERLHHECTTDSWEFLQLIVNTELLESFLV